MTILLSQDNIRDNIVSCIPRTFAGCSWPASLRWWKERPSLLVKSRDIAGLKIVISRVVKRGLEAGVGVGSILFFFLKNAVFSRFIDCVWRFCRRARSVREQAAKPQSPHSFTALSHLFFARPTKTTMLRDTNYREIQKLSCDKKLSRDKKLTRDKIIISG